MITFVRSFGYMPKPFNSKANPSEQDILNVSCKPPVASTLHCKPWVDAQKLGFEIPYGFKTDIEIHFDGTGGFEIKNYDSLVLETGMEWIIDSFVDGHIGINTGYAFESNENWDILVDEPNSLNSKLNLVKGLIGESLFPKTLFIVLKLPSEPMIWKLTRGVKICKIIPIYNKDKHEIREMTQEELLRFKKNASKYAEDEKKLTWVDARGVPFSTTYKQWAKNKKNENN